METESSIAPAENWFADLTVVEQAAVIGGYALMLIAFAAFFYFFVWKIYRAQMSMPKELEGMRRALERIAETLEQKSP